MIKTILEESLKHLNYATDHEIVSIKERNTPLWIDVLEVYGTSTFLIYNYITFTTFNLHQVIL